MTESADDLLGLMDQVMALMDQVMAAWRPSITPTSRRRRPAAYSGPSR
jgi:hypothetical protein